MLCVAARAGFRLLLCCLPGTTRQLRIMCPAKPPKSLLMYTPDKPGLRCATNPIQQDSNTHHTGFHLWPILHGNSPSLSERETRCTRRITAYCYHSLNGVCQPRHPLLSNFICDIRCQPTVGNSSAFPPQTPACGPQTPTFPILIALHTDVFFVERPKSCSIS